VNCLWLKTLKASRRAFKSDALANAERFEEAHIKVHGPLSMFSVTSNRGQAGIIKDVPVFVAT